MSKVFEHFMQWLEDNGPEHPSEIEIEEEPLSNCCSAEFSYPGWPDSDICSECGEHADIGEDE